MTRQFLISSLCGLMFALVSQTEAQDEFTNNEIFIISHVETSFNSGFGKPSFHEAGATNTYSHLSQEEPLVTQVTAVVAGATGTATSTFAWRAGSQSGFVLWCGHATSYGSTGIGPGGITTAAGGVSAATGYFNMTADVDQGTRVSSIKFVRGVQPTMQTGTVGSNGTSQSEGFLPPTRMVSAGQGVTSAFNYFARMWAIEGQGFQGEGFNNPLPGLPPVADEDPRIDVVAHQPDEEGDEPVERSETVTGINLRTITAVPVIKGGYGHTNTVFIDPELAIGFGYALDGTNKFHTFQIPEALPQGDDMFVIAHNQIAYELAAGDIFDFTTIDPLGVDSFLLLGIDETELIDPKGNAHPPFVYGATFMNPGIAEVTTFSLVYVVLGDANRDGEFNNADIASFVLALTNPVAYQAMFPNVDPDVVLDMNGDEVFNNSDIAGFVAALTGP